MAAGKRGCPLILFVVALTASCGSDGSESEAGNCTPGRSVECTGPSGCSGYQECKDDGSGYADCICGNGPEGTETGGNATGGTSATAGSGGNAAGIAAGGAGASADDGPGSCMPADMSDWTAPPYVPARPAQEVCTVAQVEDYITNSCHFGGCADYEAGGELEACGECLAPSASDATAHGSMVELTVGTLTSVETNSAGCVELAGQADCAAHVQALDACAREACLRTCSPRDSSEYNLYSACKAAARSGPCADYASPAACLLPEAVAACSGTDTFVQLGIAFCAE